jgi:hypothetical protein
MLIFGRRRAHEGLKVPLVGFCRETPRGPNPWFHVFPPRPKVGVSRLKTSYVSLKKTLSVYICVCLLMWTHARVRVCVLLCVYVCVRVCLRACIFLCALPVSVSEYK